MFKKLTAVLVLVASCLSMADGLWIYTKAYLAQHFIASAWRQSLEQAKPVKPWSWADTWPVARLSSDRHRVDLFILDGAQGNALAFGPGYLHGSAKPGTAGVSVVGGHRDTHFRFMQHLQPGDRLQVENHRGQPKLYQVTRLEVRDSRYQPLWGDSQQELLLLVTCYPFNTIDSGGPLRLVATAVPVHTEDLKHDGHD